MGRKVSNTQLAQQISGTISSQSVDQVKEKGEQISHIKHYRNEQASIIRQSCLKSAVSLVSGKVNGKTNLDNISSDVIKIAELFESWVNR